MDRRQKKEPDGRTRCQAPEFIILLFIILLMMPFDRLDLMFLGDPLSVFSFAPDAITWDSGWRRDKVAKHPEVTAW